MHFFIRFFQTVFAIVGLLISAGLSFSLTERLVSLQEQWYRRESDLVFGPTDLTELFIFMTFFFLFITLLLWISAKVFRSDFAKFTAKIFSFFLLPVGVLLLPLAFNTYIAADQQAFYHNPFWGLEREGYDWGQSKVILDYETKKKEGSRKSGSREVRGIFPSYLIERKDGKSYDLWRMTDETEHYRGKIELLDDIVRKQEVETEVRRRVGAEELDRVSKEERDFFIRLFNER